MNELIIPIKDPIVELKNLSVSYTKGKNAVDAVTAGIKKNKITAIE